MTTMTSTPPTNTYEMDAVRGASPESIQKIRIGTDQRQGLLDAIVMTFHVRNIHGGKGERQVFKDTYRFLYTDFPQLMLDVADLIPEFGSWDDLFRMAGDMGAEFQDRVVEIARNQLIEDELIVMSEGSGGSGGPRKTKSISLCAKWAPRERSGRRSKTSHLHRNEKKVLVALSQALFPNLFRYSDRMAAYRHMISKLNAYLQTVETYMCGGNWAAIDPKTVPVRAGSIYCHAFLNLKSDATRSRVLRKPDDEDRMMCRKNFIEHYTALDYNEDVTGSERKQKLQQMLELSAPQYDIVRMRVSAFLDKPQGPCYCERDDRDSPFRHEWDCLLIQPTQS
jgi:hypothetical protein